MEVVGPKDGLPTWIAEFLVPWKVVVVVVAGWYSMTRAGVGDSKKSSSRSSSRSGRSSSGICRYMVTALGQTFQALMSVFSKLVKPRLLA